jgi:hypothetical protein
MVVIPTVMVAPTMMMVRVMMIPSGMMPRMMHVVDGAMLREGMIVSVMMATVRGRVVRVSAFCMAVMTVAAVAVRMMSSVPMTTMSALGKGGLMSSKDQSDDQRQSQPTQRSHDFRPSIRRFNSPGRSRQFFRRPAPGQSLKPGFGTINRDFAAEISKIPIFFWSTW